MPAPVLVRLLPFPEMTPLTTFAVEVPVSKVSVEPPATWMPWKAMPLVPPLTARSPAATTPTLKVWRCEELLLTAAPSPKATSLPLTVTWALAAVNSQLVYVFPETL